MQTNLRVNYADGSTKSVSTTPADIVAFESKFEISIARLSTEFKMTYLYYLAWHVESRTKQSSLDFEAWLETIESVEGEDPKASKG